MGIVDLPAVRAHLRLEADDTSQDNDLQGLILAAASHIEQEYGLVAAQRQQAFAFDRFGRLLTVPLRPADVGSLQVSYLDGAGDEQQLDSPRALVLDGWTRVAPADRPGFPRTAEQPGAVSVVASVGFDADPGIDPCAGALRAAMLMMIDAIYCDRSAGPPPGVELLLDSFRLKRV